MSTPDENNDPDPFITALERLVDGYRHATDEADRRAKVIASTDALITASAGTGAALIVAERRHAIEECGFDAAHDEQHTPWQLERAARAVLNDDPALWPFTDGFKPTLPYRRHLIIAGQFIAAAIDRLDALNGDQDASS